MLDESILNRLAQIEERYEQINEQMAQPEVATDIAALQTLAREQRQIAPVVEKYREYARVLKDLRETEALLNEIDDAEMRSMAQTELAELQARLEPLDAE